jgi:hypothetical protein
VTVSGTEPLGKAGDLRLASLVFGEGAQRISTVVVFGEVIDQVALGDDRDLVDDAGGDHLDLDTLAARHHRGTDAETHDVHLARGDRLDDGRAIGEAGQFEVDAGFLRPAHALDDEQLAAGYDRHIGHFQGHLGARRAGDGHRERKGKGIE